MRGKGGMLLKKDKKEMFVGEQERFGQY